MASKFVDLTKYKVLILDFDGVIKESVEVKDDAYVSIFENIENNIKVKISKHHLGNGGVSRYEKVPLYLGWSGLRVDKKTISHYLDKFSNAVFRGVINSAWVKGFPEFIVHATKSVPVYIATATPTEEMNRILKELKSERLFKGVYGAPESKSKIIDKIIFKEACLPSDVLFIGDSLSDYAASDTCTVDFILRRTPFNLEILDVKYEIRDFEDESIRISN